MTETLERPTTTEYPQDAPVVKSRRALKWSLTGLGAAVVIVAGSWGGVAYANGVSAERAHIQAVAQQHQVDAAIPGLTAQTAAIGDEADTTTADDAVAAEKQREADEIAAQQAAEAAAQAAQQAAQQHRAAGHSDRNLPAGAVVPLLNGSPDTTACASSTASTVNGIAVCD